MSKESYEKYIKLSLCDHTLKNKQEVIRRLSKIFRPAVVIWFEENGQLLSTLEYLKNLSIHGSLVNTNQSMGQLPKNISSVEKELLDMYTSEAIKGFKEKKQLQNALAYKKEIIKYMEKISSETKGCSESTKYTEKPVESIKGIKAKDDSVKTKNLDKNILNILPDIVDVYRKFRIRIKGDVIITSGNDYYKRRANSLHCRNKAIDLRSNYLTDTEQLDLANVLQQRLGGCFYVLSEHFENNCNNHIHIGYKRTNKPNEAHTKEELGSRQWDVKVNTC